MELRQLKTFVSVADTGNMSLASKLCNLSQSAISQQIKAMEDELGMQLFVRNLRDLKLTEAGEMLIPHAINIINEVKTAKEEICGMKGKVFGALNIGAGYAIEPYLRTAQIEMMRQYPDVQLNIQYGQSASLHELLVNRKIDLAFTMNHSYPGEGIVSIPCIPFMVCAIMTKTHQLAKNKEVSFKDIENIPVVLPEVGERTSRTVMEKMGYDIHNLKVKAVTNNASSALDLVEATNLITFLPCLYVRDRSNLVAKPIKELDFELTSNVHYMKDAFMKNSAREFIRLVKEHSIPYYRCILSCYKKE